MSDEDWEKWTAERLANNGFNDLNRREIRDGVADRVLGYFAAYAVAGLLALFVSSMLRASWSTRRDNERIDGAIVLLALMSTGAAACSVSSREKRIPKGHLAIPHRGREGDPEWESARTKLTQGACLVPWELSIRIEPVNKPAADVAQTRVQQHAERLREQAELTEIEITARKEALRQRRVHLRDLVDERIAEKMDQMTMILKRACVALPPDIERKLFQAREGNSVYTLLETDELEIDPGVQRALAHEIDGCERAIDMLREEFE